DTPVGEALSVMEAQAVDALPVEENGQVGVVTRVRLERFLKGEQRKPRPEPPFTATEIPR
ncbi:MAG: CBS domain-containing protein, partial [Archangium sp.]